MRFKLDENFGSNLKEILQRGGSDVLTVKEQGLGGAPDAAVLPAAITEVRILINMDMDFGDVLRYPPKETAGIAVLRHHGRATRGILRSMAQAFVEALDQGKLRGRPWIVEPGRIREHESAAGADPDVSRED